MKTTADTPSAWLIKELILIKVSFLIANKAWTEIVPLSHYSFLTKTKVM